MKNNKRHKILIQKILKLGTLTLYIDNDRNDNLEHVYIVIYIQ